MTPPEEVGYPQSEGGGQASWLPPAPAGLGCSSLPAALCLDPGVDAPSGARLPHSPPGPASLRSQLTKGRPFRTFAPPEGHLLDLEDASFLPSLTPDGLVHLSPV